MRHKWIRPEKPVGGNPLEVMLLVLKEEKAESNRTRVWLISQMNWKWIIAIIAPLWLTAGAVLVASVSILMRYRDDD